MRNRGLLSVRIGQICSHRLLAANLFWPRVCQTVNSVPIGCKLIWPLNAKVVLDSSTDIFFTREGLVLIVYLSSELRIEAESSRFHYNAHHIQRSDWFVLYFSLFLRCDTTTYLTYIDSAVVEPDGDISIIS